jgi:hypothetical protein
MARLGSWAVPTTKASSEAAMLSRQATLVSCHLCNHVTTRTAHDDGCHQTPFE